MYMYYSCLLLPLCLTLPHLTLPTHSSQSSLLLHSFTPHFHPIIAIAPSSSSCILFHQVRQLRSVENWSTRLSIVCSWQISTQIITDCRMRSVNNSSSLPLHHQFHRKCDPTHPTEPPTRIRHQRHLHLLHSRHREKFHQRTVAKLLGFF